MTHTGQIQIKYKPTCCKCALWLKLNDGCIRHGRCSPFTRPSPGRSFFPCVDSLKVNESEVGGVSPMRPIATTARPQADDPFFYPRAFFLLPGFGPAPWNAHGGVRPSSAEMPEPPPRHAQRGPPPRTAISFSPSALFLTGFRTGAVERSRRRPPVVGGGARLSSAAPTPRGIAPCRASCGLP